MNTLLRHAACAAALLAASAAHATTYEFSYDFLNGKVVSGSFDGTAQGNLVTKISNIDFNVNGTDVPGTISASSATGSGKAVFSFDGLANSFLLSNSSHQYLLLSGAFAGAVTDVMNYSTVIGNYAEGPGVVPYSATRWHLSEVTAVPEPATYAMLLGGLLMTGWAARRRAR